MSSFEERNVNAARLIFGLANIGYKSYAAIEDIIDNSVSAKSTNVNVVLDVEDDRTLIEKNSLRSIYIIDNGIGMSDENIRKALDIGSDVTYEEKSLSKYGFGLKSAGLSLGRRISVASKEVNSNISRMLTLDSDVIEDKGKYGVIVEDVCPKIEAILNERESGTVIRIEKISVSDTVNSLKNKLLSRLGIIYYEFLVRELKPLSIDVKVKDNLFVVDPIDILYRNDCLTSFDEYNYDCKTPCTVINNKEMTLPGSGEDVPPIKINATIFPQAAMGSYPAFSVEEREKIKKYSVSGTNSGFFIFRNGRLIRWGDNLGIITRDLRTFRARIDISSEHDELLNVDVSKQNLVLPDEFLDELSLVCRMPKSDALKGFKLCSALIESNDEREGELSSDSVIDITEEDPQTQLEPTDSSIKKQRRKNILASSQSEDNDKVDERESSSVNKIRYLDFLTNTNLWQTSLDAEYGTIVKINKSHQFYRLVLSNLKAADPKRQAIECFLYCVAVGENKTKENLSSVEYEDIVKTLDRFESVTSWNLQNWTAHNQDLFD
ncbi:ATP-binding protein [Vibrio vulnificus]|uniref:ATP-binding protein n=1 Tax=Vibrio vulnificus TaxID=672 RepID=UPI000C9CAEDE|nr:ATP-binding protein [Vibrio vulnificus]EHU4927930.1 ATP-binding protein [Vibrio vulnificus]EIT7022718.1 ATP-binding protein [Vibrio vulnificus]EIV8620957.1 ATP-binding protein [Vibrio vulnificus]ELQ2523456.1 ATP-binding protein [Vibrio vulnificus]EME0099320.1 ATP-binding protein [Vibrio vulnificus]